MLLKFVKKTMADFCGSFITAFVEVWQMLWRFCCVGWIYNNKFGVYIAVVIKKFENQMVLLQPQPSLKIKATDWIYTCFESLCVTTKLSSHSQISREF